MSTKPKTSTEFEMLYDVLNAAQRQAVDAIEGPVMVIAGPGTGKTTILTLRMANILKSTDTAPENILALTFTESGAFAMRRKLLTIIGPAAYKVSIHTFHGFAERVIKEYPDYFPRIIGSSIVSDADQIKILEEIIGEKEIDILRPYGDPQYYVRPVASEIHILKRENVSPEALEKSIGREEPAVSKTEKERQAKRDDKNRELAFVYRRYQEELAKRKLYDFDDMLLELIRAMESDQTFKLMLQENHHYILADEHQDANASQNRILELLSDFHRSPNLFIVGDDKQAIYRFQGASLENFLYFKEKHEDALVIDLEHNYRSHQGILDAAHSLISNNPSIPGRDRKRLLSLQVGRSPIGVDELETRADELRHTASKVRRLIEEDGNPEEIAILYRENKEAEAISKALSEQGIAHRIESDWNILRQEDVAKAVMLARAVYDPSDSQALGQALLLPESECDPAEVAEAFKEASRKRSPLHAVIKHMPKGSSLADAYSRIVSWSRQSQSKPFPDLLHQIIGESQMVVPILDSPDAVGRLAALEALHDQVSKAAESKRTFYLKDFIEYIDVISDHGLNTKRSHSEHQGGVRLMTAHRSKGLEFDHVFIMNAVDGTWGNRQKRSLFNIPIVEHARDAGRIEDERRLFYVAMTRARRSVNISYARSDGDKERVPSQFIAEIDPSLAVIEKPVPAEMESAPDSRASATNDAGNGGTPGVGAPHPLLDPAFVRSKFLNQPFSVTHLNNYLKCPWEYFFVNLIRLPQAQSKNQMYGTAVHAALRDFFNAYKDGRDLSKKQLVAIFKHHLSREPMSADDRDASETKGAKALGGYFDWYKGSWERRLATEISIKGGLDIGDDSILPLTGKLDKIEFIGPSAVRVIDYKTSKPKSRNELEGKTKDANGDYKRQLQFYKLLLDEDGKYAMEDGVIEFIEPNDRGSYKREAFAVGIAEVSALKDVIRRTAEEILGLGFLGTACKEKDCEYCRLGKIIAPRPAGKGLR
ncbi:MAG: ATP-dependent helicase [Patescibacteria group bacterium]|nr:ATP-dependent helicase [Patescibacteria group bacterium]